MSNRTISARAIAQAFWEYREDNPNDDAPDAIAERAEAIDAEKKCKTCSGKGFIRAHGLPWPADEVPCCDATAAPVVVGEDLAIKKALLRFDATMIGVEGCRDGNCVVRKPIGMHTNGGCKCSSDRHRAGRVMQAAKELRAALAAALAGD